MSGVSSSTASLSSLTPASANAVLQALANQRRAVPLPDRLRLCLICGRHAITGDRPCAECALVARVRDLPREQQLALITRLMEYLPLHEQHELVTGLLAAWGGLPWLRLRKGTDS